MKGVCERYYWLGWHVRPRTVYPVRPRTVYSQIISLINGWGNVPIPCWDRLQSLSSHHWWETGLPGLGTPMIVPQPLLLFWSEKTEGDQRTMRSNRLGWVFGLPSSRTTPRMSPEGTVIPSSPSPRSSVAIFSETYECDCEYCPLHLRWGKTHSRRERRTHERNRGRFSNLRSEQFLPLVGDFSNCILVCSIVSYCY